MKKEQLYQDLLTNFQVPEEKSKDEIWAEIDQKINGQSSKTDTKTRSFPKRVLALAAAACVALALFTFWPDSNYSYASNNESTTVTLPDGSSVELAAHSEFTYEEINSERIIQLKGTAYFEVTKGQPFIVNTSSCAVKVLGTTFKVHSDENDYDVKCYTGKVQVNSGANNVVLSPKKGINSFNKGSVYSITHSYNDSKKNKIFENEFLDEVIKTLNFDSDIKIVNSSSSNPVISYHIKTESVEEICNTLAIISGLKVKQVGKNTLELY